MPSERPASSPEPSPLPLSSPPPVSLPSPSPEPEPDETGCPKSEVERLIERINAIQSELPAHRAVYYEDEKAFSDAAEEHYAALYRALPAERRKR